MFVAFFAKKHKVLQERRDDSGEFDPLDIVDGKKFMCDERKSYSFLLILVNIKGNIHILLLTFDAFDVEDCHEIGEKQAGKGNI